MPDANKMGLIAQTYDTCILPGFNPDPTIVHHPDLGYFLCTSTFEFWPGLPIYHSKDLINWKLIGHALTRRSQGVDMRTVESNGGLYAPTLRIFKGRFVVTCCCIYRRGSSDDGVPPRGFYLWTHNIFDETSWTDAIYVDELGIDQDLFFDDDDRCYLSVARRITDPNIPVVNFHCGVYTSEIDITTGRNIHPAILARVSPTGCAEGSHIFKRKGWYYMLVAEGGTEIDHQEWVMRSHSPMGPWQLPPPGVNPILHNGAHPEVQQTGHVDFVENVNTGLWYAVFLGVRPVGSAATMNGHGGMLSMASHLGRETFMAPVDWQANGWPRVNLGRNVELVGEAFGIGSKAVHPSVWDFKAEDGSLDKHWYTLRSPLKPFHTVDPSKSTITVHGGAYTLAMDECVSMLLRKQKAFAVDWEVKLDFRPTNPNEEAGIVAWNRKEAYAALGLCRDEANQMNLLFHTPSTAKDKYVRVPVEASELPVTLRVEARTKVYKFLYRLKGGDFEVIGTVKASAMMPLFTGAFFGIYAHGDGTGAPSQRPAVFGELSMAQIV